MDYYDVAQICLNGHTITRNARNYPQHTKKFCPKCGEQTISSCPVCSESILGEYHIEGFIGIGVKAPPPPNFCHNCGQPYPWTARKIESAKALADEFDDLSPVEREKLKQSLDDLYRDSPKTELATAKFKKLMTKVGQESYMTMKEILIGIISEAARKSIFGG